MYLAKLAELNVETVIVTTCLTISLVLLIRNLVISGKNNLPIENSPETDLNSILKIAESLKKTTLSLKNKELMAKKVEDLSLAAEAGKEKIEAIFRVQDDRNQKKKWVEWLAGFVIGVISSLTATALVAIF